MNRRRFSAFSGVMMLLSAAVCLGLTVFPIPAYAAEQTVTPSGSVMETDGSYLTEVPQEADDGAADYAAFALTAYGDLQENADENGIPVYGVSGDTVSLSLTYAAPDGQWQPVFDDTRAAGTFSFSESIGSGAAVLQTSKDGVNWVTEKTMTDIAGSGSDTIALADVGQEKLQGGCYCRVYLFYLLEDGEEPHEEHWFAPETCQQKRITQLFEIKLETAADEAAGDSGGMDLGSAVRTGEGFDGSTQIGGVDPHYGWKIGTFTVSGYNAKTDGDGQVPVFLTDGDEEAVLSFTLQQDIDQIGGNPDLSVADDEMDYDTQSGIARQYFGRGMLIVQYTDSSGAAGQPSVTADYLSSLEPNTASNILTCKEGDYTVTLDYQIEDRSDFWDFFDLGTSDANYQICFSFSVRSDQCDIGLQAADSDTVLDSGAIAAGGFQAQFTGSKYQSVQYRRQNLISSEAGYRLEDAASGSVHDGQTFTDEGIYTLTAQNPYTGESVEKTVYVGTDRLSSEFVSSGADLDSFGTGQADQASNMKGAAAMTVIFAAVGVICLVISMREKNMDG